MPFLAGQTLTAQALNDVTDPPLAHLYRAAQQTIANATWTAIQLDSELQDSHNGHSTSTNPSRYTCQRAGVYEFSGAVSFFSNATGIRSGRVIKNGTTTVTGSLELRNATNGDHTCFAIPVSRERLALGDYVELWVYQNCGGPLFADPTANGAACALSVAYAGP